MKFFKVLDSFEYLKNIMCFHSKYFITKHILQFLRYRNMTDTGIFYTNYSFEYPNEAC